MKAKTISWIGWYGVLAILVAYALVTFGVVAAKSYPYQLLNLTGALGLVIEAGSKKDTQPAALNAVWAIVAIIAIVQLIVG
jgi:hypothetical protein